MRKQRVTQQSIVFGIFVVLFVGFSLFLPGFFNADNMLALLQNVAILGILGLGMAVVVIGRGIDISLVASLAVPPGLILQMVQNGAVADINMAVPINLLPPILDDLITRGAANRPPRPWLGVFSAESDGDVVVMNVSENSPADQAGLQRGDIISDIRDAEIGGLADFYRKVWDSGQAGAEVPMRIVRDGRENWVRIKSADRNAFLRRPHLQ
mgnify:CR=1 FL=1